MRLLLKLQKVAEKQLGVCRLFLLLFATLKVSAQNGFSDIIKINPSDATKLIDAYGQPLFKGFGVDMNSGWANTAKVKKVLHFELRVSASAAFTPASDKSFDVTKIGLSNNVQPESGQSPIAQTIGGDKNLTGPIMDIYDATHSKVIGTFTMPSGKLPVIPAPQVQLTVGLPEQTDLTIRYIPNVSAGNNVGSVNMIGFGLKHDLTNYLFGPATKLVPFDLSVLLAYSRMNLSAGLNVQPDEGSQPESTNTTNDFNNQHTEGHFTSFLGELILSKKILFFTPFVAVGYNTASTNLAAVGNYPVPDRETLTQEYYTVYTNPVNISETSISGLRADIGFQLDLGIRIFASASVAQYKSVNGGIGFGF